MTSIEWTDETWNPTDGCEVCSPGCANCYAMRFAGRFAKPGERYHGLVSIGKNKRAIWTGETRLDPGKLAKPLRWKKPRRIFVNSMSDLFYEGFTNEQIAAVFGVMAACPQHTFQVLTKRAKRMREWFQWVESRPSVGSKIRAGSVCSVSADAALGGNDDAPIRVELRRLLWLTKPTQWPLSNVILGVSVENQDAADERIPDLLRTPAALRMVSCEPLIGPVDLRAVGVDRIKHDALTGRWSVPQRDGSVQEPRIHWVIVGCESGPGARPSATSWLADLRDQCEDAGTPFFLKQATQWVWAHGTKPPTKYEPDSAVTCGPGSQRKAGRVIGLPYLDGVQHAAFPVLKERS